MTSPQAKCEFIFLNQVTGPLFRELAEDLSQQVGPSVLIAGNIQALCDGKGENLSLISAPEYRREGNWYRILTWCRYFVFVLCAIWRLPSSGVLFIVSNPPFLPLCGFLMKKLRRQPYVVLVYDIYPDLLIRFGRLTKNNPLAVTWKWFNRHMLEQAEVVFTIGDVMAANLEAAFDSSKTKAGKVVTISNWADDEFIKPLSKSCNEFAKKHGQVDKLTILYSGNFGETHDIETLLEATLVLQGERTIHFLFIGEGSKRSLVEKFISEHHLTNVTLLPFQREEILPFSLATGDVAVVTLNRGAEGLSVPSKSYYALAAGSALLGVACGDNELTRLIEQNECGLVVEPGNRDGIVQAVKYCPDNPTFLNSCRERSRQLAEKVYSRKNTSEYFETLCRLKVVS